MLKPLLDRLVVRLDESLPNQAGLILRPDVNKWREALDQIGNRGTVVAVGPGKRHPESGVLLPVAAKVGDVVRFSELEYPKHSENGHTYVVISDMDVVGIEEDGEMPKATLPPLEFA